MVSSVVRVRYTNDQSMIRSFIQLLPFITLFGGDKGIITMTHCTICRWAELLTYLKVWAARS